jgi:hypothetical protein
MLTYRARAFHSVHQALLAMPITAALLATPLLSKTAHAQTSESAFTYAFRGLGIGVPVGLSAGYLLTRDGDWDTEDWQDVGLGVAIGAIGGAVGGLTVGLIDASDGRMGTGAIVLRDTWYGTMLGITVGAIVGGVTLMYSGEAEDLLVGMAWGAVIGAPVGVGVGFIEAALREDAASPPGYAGVSPLVDTARDSTGLTFHLTPVVAPGTQRQMTWVPTLRGTF